MQQDTFFQRTEPQGMLAGSRTPRIEGRGSRGAPPPALHRAGTSSRNDRRQLGSSPTTGTPRDTKGSRATSTRGLALCLIGAGGQESAPAAQRPSAIGRCREVHAVATGGEHFECRIEVLRSK